MFKGRIRCSDSYQFKSLSSKACSLSPCLSLCLLSLLQPTIPREAMYIFFWLVCVHAESVWFSDLQLFWSFHLAQLIKNLPANAGDTREVGFDPWVRKIPWRRKWATHFSILTWRVPWTEELGELQSVGSKRVGHD